MNGSVSNSSDKSLLARAQKILPGGVRSRWLDICFISLLW